MGESLRRTESEHPSQCLGRYFHKTADQGQEVPGDSVYVWPITAFFDQCSPVIEPPRKDIVLRNPTWRYGVIDDSRWLVAQPLPCRQQPTSEFSILVPDLGARTGSQIDAKSAVLFENALPKRHLGAVRWIAKSAWLIP